MQKISYFFTTILIFIALFYPISISANINKEFYLLPTEKKEALNSLCHKIDLAKSDIKISIYTFTYKKIAKRLKNAANRGVKIEIIFDKEQSRAKNTRTMMRYLAKYRNIKVYQLQGLISKNRKYHGIMHIKMALIDKKIVIFGSANWTKSAFSKNYETLYITKDYQIAKKFLKFFNIQKSKAKLYR